MLSIDVQSSSRRVVDPVRMNSDLGYRDLRVRRAGQGPIVLVTFPSLACTRQKPEAWTTEGPSAKRSAGYIWRSGTPNDRSLMGQAALARLQISHSAHVRCMHRTGVPQSFSDRERRDLQIRPPSSLIALSMKRLMVGSAQGNGELVADLASQCSRLGELEVMCVRWRLLADKAALAPNES